MSVKAPLRQVDILILSDIHLGTYGCKAEELYSYLRSIKPKQVILNGDIVDGWNFKKRYFPNSHFAVIKQFIKWISEGVEVIYITGNHDEVFRKFSEFTLGKFQMKNKHVIKLDNDEKAWVFHGDVFDISMTRSKFLAKLGGAGYDILIGFNNLINMFLQKIGRPKISLSKRIKHSVKKAVKYISDFEQTASEIAITKGYQYVICGHIHQPQIREFKNEEGSTTYMNSGDWIEHLTSLEYTDGNWSIHNYSHALALPASKLPRKEYSFDELMTYEYLLKQFEGEVAN